MNGKKIRSCLVNKQYPSTKVPRFTDTSVIFPALVIAVTTLLFFSHFFETLSGHVQLSIKGKRSKKRNIEYNFESFSGQQ